MTPITASLGLPKGFCGDTEAPGSDRPETRRIYLIFTIPHPRQGIPDPELSRVRDAEGMNRGFPFFVALFLKYMIL
jgi:hypothetical protein